MKRVKKQTILSSIEPSASFWSLAGIIIFFFLPEIIIYFWKDSIKEYFIYLSNLYENQFLKELCLKLADTFSSNSYINISIGVILLIWWFRKRVKNKKSEEF